MPEERQTYEPLDWKDHIEDVETHKVLQWGTEFCAKNMNHIEQGIAQMWKALDTVGGAVTKEVTLPTDGWIEDTSALEEWEKFSESMVYKDIAMDEVTETLLPIVVLEPASHVTADSCYLRQEVRTMDKVVRFYAQKAPEKEIKASLVLISTGDGLPSFNYTLPVATRESLGAVIIGHGMNVTEQGLISTTTDEDIQSRIATPEEIDAMIEELFNKE